MRKSFLIPSLDDILTIFTTIIILGFALLIVQSLTLKLTKTPIFINTGYSMCKYQDPLLEYLPIDDPDCSWTPFNILLLDTRIDPNNLKVGDNVCYWSGLPYQSNLICHRIQKVKEENGQLKYWIAGLHPLSKKEWVSPNQIYAKVVDKLPRGFGAPVILVAYLGYNPLGVAIYINAGGYI